jgi:hypothetical protein
MSITMEEAKELLGGSPQDKQFAASAATLNAYMTHNKEISGLKSEVVGGTYAEGDKWDPKNLIEKLGEYATKANGYVAASGDIKKADELLGPLYSKWAADQTKHTANLKTRVLTRMRYEEEKAVFEKISTEQLKTAAEASDKAARQYITDLGDLIKKLHEIN